MLPRTPGARRNAAVGRPPSSLARPSKPAKRAKVQLDASLPQQQPEKARIIAIDYGTTKLQASIYIGPPGQQPTASTMVDITLGPEVAIPQQLAFDDHGQFYWGFEVQQMLDQNQLRYDQVLTHLKLLFYPRTVDDSPFARKARDYVEQLDTSYLPGCPENAVFETKLVFILAMHLRHVLKAIDEYTDIGNVVSKLGLKPDELARNMPRRVLISVPGMWLPPGNRSVLVAAQLAGLGCNEVELVFEPQAAAAFWVHNVVVARENRYKVGDQILFLDAGGGTSDMVVYKLTGPDMQLKATLTTNGALCGSEYVNQEFLEWVDEQARKEGGECRADLARKCGMPEAEFDGKLNITFEELKAKASASKAVWPHPILVTGGTEEHGSFSATIGKQQVEQLHEKTVARNIKLVKEAMATADRVVALIVIGGFSKSLLLIERLRQAFADRRIDIQRGSQGSQGFVHPVAQGALLKYCQAVERRLTSGDCYMLAEDQEFDPEQHPDLVKIPRLGSERRTGAKLVPDQDLIGIDPQFPRKKCAFNRVRTILPVDGRQPVLHYWQERSVPVTDPNIAFQIYWSQVARQENSAMMTENGGSTLIEGIEKWGPPIWVALPDLQRLGFEAKSTRRSKTKEYKIAVRVILLWSPERISVRLEMARPRCTDRALDNAFSYASTKLLPENDLGANDVIVLLEEGTIAQKDFNPTPRE